MNAAYIHITSENVQELLLRFELAVDRNKKKRPRHVGEGARFYFVLKLKGTRLR